MSNCTAHSGFRTRRNSNPFLLFDDFRNERPQDYQAGFPLASASGHRDHHLCAFRYGRTQLTRWGTAARWALVDVQWMTAGSGILHQEMPKGTASGQMHGFQLWGNLPSDQKMTAPRYQDVESSNIPEIIDDDGTVVRVIVGEFWGRKGPVDGIAADPQYLDISIPAGVEKTLSH